MLSLTRYTSLLWDFTYDSSSQAGKVQLRVFSSEQEMFETRGQLAPGMPVDLPINSGNQNMNRSSWSTSNVGSQASSDMGMLGWQLWQAIPPEARQPLLDANGSKPCWLKISSNSPVIDDLPWEWLNDGPPPFALRPEIRLSRSIPIRLAIPPTTIEPPVRVLLVITNPKDERLLNPYREMAAVTPPLVSPPYQLTTLSEPTLDALQWALKAEPHIVHYIGHAGISRNEGNLILHDSNNVSHWIPGSDLARVLPLSVRLLCLSTCFTAPNYQILGLPRLAHIPASTRLPNVIANQYPLSEPGVQIFWNVFYTELANPQGNVNEAFHTAQLAVANNNPSVADWGSFSLVVRDQVGDSLRVQPGGQATTDSYLEDIKAQLTSQLANALSERFLSNGSATFSGLSTGSGSALPPSVQSQIDKETAEASALTRKIDERNEL